MENIKTFLDGFIDEYSTKGGISNKTSSLLGEALSTKMARLINEQDGVATQEGPRLVFGEEVVYEGVVDNEPEHVGQSNPPTTIFIEGLKLKMFFEHGGNRYDFVLYLNLVIPRYGLRENPGRYDSFVTWDDDDLKIFKNWGIDYENDFAEAIMKNFGVRYPTDVEDVVRKWLADSNGIKPGAKVKDIFPTNIFNDIYDSISVSHLDCKTLLKGFLQGQ